MTLLDRHLGAARMELAAGHHSSHHQQPLRINTTLWWLAFGTMSIYWLINALFHLWLCAQFLRFAGRRRAEQFS